MQEELDQLAAGISPPRDYLHRRLNYAEEERTADNQDFYLVQRCQSPRVLQTHRLE